MVRSVVFTVQSLKCPEQTTALKRGSPGVVHNAGVAAVGEMNLQSDADQQG